MRLELLERFQRAYDNEIIPYEDLKAEYADTSIYLGTKVGALVWERARVDYEEDKRFVQGIEEALADERKVLPDDVFFAELHKKYLTLSRDVTDLKEN